MNYTLRAIAWGMPWIVSHFSAMNHSINVLFAFVIMVFVILI